MSRPEISDEEISSITPLLQRLAWSDQKTRAQIQEMGVDVIPCHFYSNTPSIKDIEGSYEYVSLTPPYLNTKIFDKHRLAKTLQNLLDFSKEFNPPTDGDEQNCRRFFWKNSQFSFSDAMSYYCFVRMIWPATIVEIGSGFSTLVAIEAMEKNRAGTVHCIEPFPREFLKSCGRISLHPEKAQDISPAFLNEILQDGDILFIDSTHTVKSGSDCLHIYLRLLPEIRRNIFVHAHDIFLPFGMPKDWLLERQLCWTEQYLLLAFLIDNPKASLVYGSTINAAWHPALMESLMGNQYPVGGASVWFEYRGNS